MEIFNYDTNFTDVVTDEMIFIEGGEFMMGSVEERFALQENFQDKSKCYIFFHGCS